MNAASRARARQDLEAMFRAGVAAVHGARCVAEYLENNPPANRTCIVAIGKAASAMATGALEVLGEQCQRGLVITGTGHTDPVLLQDSRFTCLETGHPIPDRRSLQAGDALCRFLAAAPRDSGLLFLVSGGASSLVEVLQDPVSLAQLRQLNQWLIASGLDIQAVNRVRSAVSRIKGGGLARFVRGHETQVLLISDVAGDDPAIIGSGLLSPGMNAGVNGIDLPDWVLDMVCAGVDAMPTGRGSQAPVEHHVIAGSGKALAAAARAGQALGYPSKVMDECLEGEAADTGVRLVAQIRRSQPGLYLWGGETTVTLPPDPGTGGRNQHLALAAACTMAKDDTMVLLSAGTDGTDGLSPAAGAVVDAGTLARGRAAGLDPGHYLRQADSGSYLEVCGDVLITGPTGTNVADMVIGFKPDDAL